MPCQQYIEIIKLFLVHRTSSTVFCWRLPTGFWLSLAGLPLSRQQVFGGCGRVANTAVVRQSHGQVLYCFYSKQIASIIYL